MKELASWKKSFFTIYLGQGFSMLSSSIVQLSIIWWITIHTNSALALSVSSIVGLLPQALIGQLSELFGPNSWFIVAGCTMIVISVICKFILDVE